MLISYRVVTVRGFCKHSSAHCVWAQLNLVYLTFSLVTHQRPYPAQGCLTPVTERELVGKTQSWTSCVCWYVLLFVCLQFWFITFWTQTDLTTSVCKTLRTMALHHTKQFLCETFFIPATCVQLSTRSEKCLSLFTNKAWSTVVLSDKERVVVFWGFLW